jgi:hypothetical protein
MSPGWALTMPDPDEADQPRYAGPLDAADPRFAGSEESMGRERPRELVRSQGPGMSPMDPRVRTLRAALPLLALAGVLAVAAVFARGLEPAGGQVEVVGDEAAVRAAIADRPLRVCLGGGQPCAWLTVADGQLLALNTSGPLREEYGRNGVQWCPTSRHFGANNTGSRFDQAGRVVDGPAPRSMDRFHVRVDDAGQVVVDFAALTTGVQAQRVGETTPPAGPHCDPIPFDREADLQLPRTQER